MIFKQKYKNLTIKKKYNPSNDYKMEVIKYFKLKNKKYKYAGIQNNTKLSTYLNSNISLKKRNLKNDLHFYKFFNFKNNQPLNYNNIMYLDITSKNIRLSLLRKNGTPIFTYSTGHFGFKKSDRKGIFSAKKLIINFLKTKDIKNKLVSSLFEKNPINFKLFCMVSYRNNLLNLILLILLFNFVG